MVCTTLQTIHRFGLDAELSCRVVQGKGKGLFAAREFSEGSELYREPVLVAGLENEQTMACGNCFVPIRSAAIQCMKCSNASYCTDACRESAEREHRHLCEGYVFADSPREEAARRKSMLAQVRAIGKDCLCTTQVIANVITRAEQSTTTCQNAWKESYGQLDSGGVAWSLMLRDPQFMIGRQQMLDAYCSVLQDCFAPQLRHRSLQLRHFLQRGNIDKIMAKVALNITNGEAVAVEGQAVPIPIWAIAAIHACTNHCCCSPSPLSNEGPNVYQSFSPHGANGLMHRCVALHDIDYEDELTLCYTTIDEAREAGFNNVQQFLEERRLFHCECRVCQVAS